MPLLKNTANQNITFGLVNASTGAALTGATVIVAVTVDANAQAAGGGAVTEKGNGQYSYKTSAADTNGTDIGFLFTAAGAIPVNLDFHTDQAVANIVNASNQVTFANTSIASVSGTVNADLQSVLGAPIELTLPAGQTALQIGGAGGSIGDATAGNQASLAAAVQGVAALLSNATYGLSALAAALATPAAKPAPIVSGNPYIDTLYAARANYAAILAEISLNPKPDYDVHGHKYSWSQYQEMLGEQIEKCNRLIAQGAPFEFVSRA